MPHPSTIRRIRFEELTKSACIEPADLLILEREFLLTKWFEYRFTSPLGATMHFAECYRAALHAYVRRHIDVDVAKRVKGVMSIPTTSTREFTSLWKARQFADKFLVPYGTYLSFWFDFAARRTRKFAPRPNQLHPGKTLEEAWWPEFVKFIEDSAAGIVSDIAGPMAYRFEAFTHLPAQVNLRNFFMDEAVVSSRPWHYFMGQWSVALVSCPSASSCH